MQAQAVSLKPYNTFGLDVMARALVRVATVDQLLQVLAQHDLKPAGLLVLGGGSNMLLTGPVEQLVIKNEIMGLELVPQPDGRVLLIAGAGENWHKTVLFAIENRLGGIENLSLIPGTMGASPIQNIGAYGVELKDVFAWCEAVEIETRSTKRFAREDCRFGYRDSVFKTELKGQYIITRVAMLLDPNAQPNTSYGNIKDELARRGIDTPSIKDVSDAVIAIRQSKLPDPAVVGNAGSFFKNPELPEAQVAQLKATYESIPVFPAETAGCKKVPAAWFIEHAGWKGKRFGNYGVHPNQALVLVNYGGADGGQIRDLAYEIRQSVIDKFGVTLTPEVNIIPQ